MIEGAGFRFDLGNEPYIPDSVAQEIANTTASPDRCIVDIIDNPSAWMPTAAGKWERTAEWLLFLAFSAQAWQRPSGRLVLACTGINEIARSTFVSGYRDLVPAPYTQVVQALEEFFDDVT